MGRIEASQETNIGVVGDKKVNLEITPQFTEVHFLDKKGLNRVRSYGENIWKAADMLDRGRLSVDDGDSEFVDKIINSGLDRFIAFAYALDLITTALKKKGLVNVRSSKESFEYKFEGSELEGIALAMVRIFGDGLEEETLAKLIYSEEKDEGLRKRLIKSLNYEKGIYIRVSDDENSPNNI